MKLAEYEFSPHSLGEGWYVGPKYGSEFDPGIAAALALQKEALQKGFFSVCGLAPGEDGFCLFLVPSKSAAQVASAFRLGEQASSYVPDAQQVSIREIEAVERRVRIAPYFADPAGLLASILSPITEDVLAHLEDVLMHAEPMMDEDGSIASYVRRENRIHLWWD